MSMYVYTAEQIRQIDTDAAEQGLSPFTLMENAGRNLFERVRKLVDPAQKICILSGRGNNGGDGIVLARYLSDAGYEVSLTFPIGEPESEVAKQHLNYYLAQGYEVSITDKTGTFIVIVDAMFGIGTRHPLPEKIKEVIEWANRCEATRIAIDIPTGVLANTGDIETDGRSSLEDERTVFRADYTLSLHGAKPSAFLYPSTYYYGELFVVPIGLSTYVKTSPEKIKQEHIVKVTSLKEVRTNISKRESSSHKGTFGTSLIVAGSDEMPGSVTLSAIGAIRSGTGRLIIGTTPSAIPVVASHVPEATFIADGLTKIANGNVPEKIVAAAIGPGLTDTTLTKQALERLMKLPLPLVVDAGALERRANWHAAGPVIITPHPGEFSRLTGHPIEVIQRNRIELAREYAIEHRIIVVLKGEYTVIAFSDGRVYINPTGNTGLAKGGSGDVLTGILTSFLATYDRVEAAVVNAVYLHGLCADEWAKTYSEATMTASDFAKLLPVVLKKLEKKE